MKSIKMKMFAQTGALVILLIFLFMITYSLFFESIYMVVAKNKLLNHYRFINSLESSEYNDIDDALKEFDKGFKLDVFITNPQETVLYQTEDYLFYRTVLEKLDVLPVHSSNHPDFFDVEKEEAINKNVRFVWAKDILLNTNTLQIIGKLDNNDSILIRVMLVPSDINIVAANRFAVIIGSFLLLVGLAIAYAISNRFTKPLITMNNVASRISRLDFTATCSVSSKDEIGQLAVKINELSNELESVIGTLNIRNNELKEEVKEKNNIDSKRKQLLNNVSHELKTPLTLLQSYAEGLKMDVARNHGKMDYYCDVILDESSKMNRLVSDLLDINRLTFKDSILHGEEFEIVDFIEELLKKYNEKFIHEEIEFTYQSIKPTSVYSDQLRFETVMDNYISNAIKYVDAQKVVNVTILDNSQSVRIEVYNTTPRISENELPKLWDTFYKLDESRSGRSDGHGLGLSIVKAIQEAEGNGYGVRSDDKGITFWVELPVVAYSESQMNTEREL